MVYKEQPDRIFHNQGGLKNETHLDLSIGENLMTATVRPDTPVGLDEPIELVFNMEKIHLFKSEDGEAIF